MNSHYAAKRDLKKKESTIENAVKKKEKQFTGTSLSKSWKAEEELR